MNDAAATPYVLAPAELLVALAHLEDRAPLGLIEAATAHGDAMVAALADVVDGELAWAGESHGEWWLLLHAAMILGRIPTQAAGLQLARLLRALDEHGEEEMQDWLSGHWAPLFANKPQDAIDNAVALAQDVTLAWYARCQMLDVILDSGRRSGDEALERAIDHVADMAANADDDWIFRSMAACALLGYPRLRHRALLESTAKTDAALCRKRGTGPALFDAATVEQAFAKGHDDPIWLHREDPWAFYTPEAIAARQQRWQEEARHADDAFDPDLLDEREVFHGAYDDLPVTHVRVTPKLGRNDPCHCGSGKKYKQCCLAKDDIAEREARAQPF